LYCFSQSKRDVSFQQGLSGKTVRLIAESCQHLEKLTLHDVTQIDDNDVIHVTKKLGKQLTTLALDGEHVTDVAYFYLKNCSR
jgi:predicted transcriptional regulator